MKSPIKLVLFFLLLAFPVKGYTQKVVFLHHSTGWGVYSEGNVASWILSYNATHGKLIQLFDINFPDTPWPWENYPYDYWKLWIDGSCNSGNPGIQCLNTLAANYDLIILKHCYPGADIQPNTGNPDISSSVKTLENYKAQYRALRALFDTYPNTKFMVWTLAPLHRLATTPETAQRANEFVQWVKNGWLVEDGNSHPNIIIFDFFSLVAELNPNPPNGIRYCLKYDYESSHTDSDSHPNTEANQYTGPVYAQAIANAFVTAIPVTGITVTGAGGASTISIPGGTLQLSATVLPANATNKTLTWTIANGTGKAIINATGLVTAIANGTITATANAFDGSGVTGSLEITLSKQVFTNLYNERNHEFYAVLSSNKLIINPDAKNIEFDFCSLYTIQGVLLHREKITGETIKIDISSYLSGIYIVSLSNDQQVFPLKLVIP